MEKPMKNILIATTLTTLCLIAPIASAGTNLCNAFDSAIALGQSAKNCGNILSIVAEAQEKNMLKTNKHCQSYLNNKDDVVTGLVTMPTMIQKACLSSNPNYRKKLNKISKHIDLLNPILKKHGM